MNRTMLDDPSNCLCFNVRRAARSITQTYDRALRPTGLRITQFSLLAVLSKAAPPEGIALGPLAEILGMDRTTLTRNLAIAERDGWIGLLTADDRRSRLASLTLSGKAAFKKAFPLWKGAQETLYALLGNSQFTDVLALTRSLNT